MMRLQTAVLMTLMVLGCRGGVSDKPPFHVIPDMDWQPKFVAQQEFKDTTIFKDGRAARPLVEDTVAQGQLAEDDAFYRGKNGDAFVALAPIAVDQRTLERGQARFNIYCAPCHDRTGSGRGIVVQRGYPLPPDLSGDAVRAYPDGHIFNVISNGIRNMPSYGYQIPAQDRWAIVAWVRVLARSQHGSLEDVPPESRGTIAPEGGAL